MTGGKEVGGGATQQTFIWGKSAKRSKPIHTCRSFLKENLLPVSQTKSTNKASSSCTLGLHSTKCCYKYLNDSFHYTFLCFKLWNPYPIIYLGSSLEEVPLSSSACLYSPPQGVPHPHKPEFYIKQLLDHNNF